MEYTQFNKHYYSPYIQIKDDPVTDPNDWDGNMDRTYAFRCATEHVSDCGYYPWRYGSKFTYTDFESLSFPKPLKEEININMMPISMKPATFNQQLPKELHGYIPWIHACINADGGLHEKICYLTIHESFVEKGKSQRRPGLHIELPGAGVGGDSEWFFGWGLSYFLFVCVSCTYIYFIYLQ